MARTKHAIQKAALDYLGRLNGFKGIISLVRLAPAKTLILANNEMTVGEVYKLMGDLGERLWDCRSDTTWQHIDKAGVISDFVPVLKKKKKRK